MSSENVLARSAARVAHQNPTTADFTHNVLRPAIREVVACFPVYGTYVDSEASTEETGGRGRTRRSRILASATPPPARNIMKRE